MGKLPDEQISEIVNSNANPVAIGMNFTCAQVEEAHIRAAMMKERDVKRE